MGVYIIIDDFICYCIVEEELMWGKIDFIVWLCMYLQNCGIINQVWFDGFVECEDVFGVEVCVVVYENVMFVMVDFMVDVYVELIFDVLVDVEEIVLWEDK